MSVETSHLATLTVGEVLGRISALLEHLAQEVHAVEATVNSTHVLNSKSTMPSIYRLQSLDFLHQSLEDLAVLVFFLSGQKTIDETALQDPESILKNLRLDVVSELVKARKLLSQADTNRPSKGDFDLF